MGSHSSYQDAKNSIDLHHNTCKNSEIVPVDSNSIYQNSKRINLDSRMSEAFRDSDELSHQSPSSRNQSIRDYVT